MNFELNVFGSKDKSFNERAKEQNDDRINGGYGSNYYDENEQRAGQEKYNLATGEKYKNDIDIEPAHAFTSVEEADGSLEEEFDNDDVVAKLLKANGYDKFGNKI